MNNYITGVDFILIVFYLLLIVAIGHGFSRKIKYKVIREYFVKGLLLKLLCGLGFDWVYVYYYGGGDNVDALKPYGYLLGEDKKKSSTIIDRVKKWFGKNK